MSTHHCYRARLLVACLLASCAPATFSAAGTEKVSSVSTKFDFVLGDKVVFMYDMAQDEFGEFPASWSLMIGTVKVAEMDGRRPGAVPGAGGDQPRPAAVRPNWPTSRATLAVAGEPSLTRKNSSRLARYRARRPP
jgi:hypothetical protein